jgi:magnesium-transporting ATPase (P-type)
VPDNYDETYKYFTRRGSRVLALGQKEMPAMSANEVSPRSFLGFFCSFSFGEVLFG